MISPSFASRTHAGGQTVARSVAAKSDFSFANLPVAKTPAFGGGISLLGAPRRGFLSVALAVAGRLLLRVIAENAVRKV